MKRNVAIVALVNEKGEVFLVRTKRYPDMWQPIGGGIEEADGSPEAAVVREALEETELVIAPNALEKITVVPFDFGEGEVHCFQAPVTSDVQLKIDEAEIVESGWFSLAAALKLPTYPATKAFLEKLSV